MYGKGVIYFETGLALGVEELMGFGNWGLAAAEAKRTNLDDLKQWARSSVIGKRSWTEDV